jgi:polygalacturonase
MDGFRREFLKLSGAATLVAPAMLARGARSAIAPIPAAGVGTVFNVRSFGAVGDGKTIDSPAINLAIDAAGAQGGTVYVPGGTYACYSLRLKSAVTLYVEQGATILAADTPRGGTTSPRRFVVCDLMCRRRFADSAREAPVVGWGSGDASGGTGRLAPPPRQYSAWPLVAAAKYSAPRPPQSRL